MSLKELEELIGTVPDKYAQNLSPELGYGFLQPIDGWLPGQEIQHDGHNRYMLVTPRKE